MGLAELAFQLAAPTWLDLRDRRLGVKRIQRRWQGTDRESITGSQIRLGLQSAFWQTSCWLRRIRR